MRLAIFLFCVGLATAVPLHSSDLYDFDEFNLQARGSEGIGEKLQEHLENIINRIKKAVDEGKGVREDLWKRAEDFYEKLKNLGVDIGEKLKNAFEELRNKIGKKASSEGIGEKLKEHLENIINRIKKAVEDGKGVREDLWKKAEDFYEKLKNLGVDMGEKLKNAFEELRNKIGQKASRSEGIGEKLKEHLENIINRIKKAVEEGKGVREDLWKRAEDFYDKLKNLGVDIGEKLKNAFEELRNKIGQKAPTTSNADFSNLIETFQKLKQLIKEKLDPEELKAKVENLFGKGSEMAEQIFNMLREKGEKGKNKILDWLDHIIPDKEERSISDVYNKLKEFFRDLNLDLKERFTRFGEWVKDKYEKGLERGKTRAENIKRIAKEFIEDTKAIGKDMAEEAHEFFWEYKQDLGKLYDEVVEKVRQIMKS